MLKKTLVVLCFIAVAGAAESQVNPADTTPVQAIDTLELDDDMELEELLDDLDLFMDSILTPRNYVLLNMSVTQGYYNFTNKNNDRMSESRKAVWSPTFGYYDKAGIGITASSYVIYDSSKRYVYQASLTPSFDYLKNRNLATGISFTRFFTRNKLPFYTSPLQNAFSAYFLWRKSWLQPGFAANYGWGSRTEYKKIEKSYRELLADAVNTGTIPRLDTVSILRKNTESIVDFSLTPSVRHDFYWLDIFSKKDHIRFSPLLAVSMGTQKFGFNQSNTAFGNLRAVTYTSTRNISLQQKFQLLSATLYLRSEYCFGKFFIQPQVLFDYYFPGPNTGILTLFSVNAGFLL